MEFLERTVLVQKRAYLIFGFDKVSTKAVVANRNPINARAQAKELDQCCNFEKKLIITSIDPNTNKVRISVLRVFDIMGFLAFTCQN
jgi:hypothetical protein